MDEALQQIGTSRDGERLDPALVSSKSEYVSFLKHLKAYDFLKDFSGAKNALEIGCGTGYGTNYASDFLKKITALEVDEKLIQMLNSKNRKGNVSFKWYDGIRLPFSDHTFDLIYTFQVIEHIHDDLNFLKEIYRVLKPGGTAIITTPNRLYRLKEGQRPFNRFHIREYSPQQLRDLIHFVFTDAKIMGVFGTDEIHQIEHARIKSGLSKYDPLNLRRFLPSTLVSKLGRIIKKTRINPPGETEDFRSNFDLQSYRVSGEDIDRSLDLLAWCNK